MQNKGKLQCSATKLVWKFVTSSFICIGKRKETPSSASEEDTPLTKTFRSYQQELDERHDKYERIVKLSRDITVESKRAIFLLHRAAGYNPLLTSGLVHPYSQQAHYVEMTSY